ncbi:MAG TPA: polymer-forming cytoskeletal protein [Polyangiaceae bacterium]|jgi:cytoskeletal protein CcmA (bactofilin family)
MAQARTTPRTGDAAGARIGSGARVRGRIHGDGDLVVEGQVEGDLAIRGELTIAEGGNVASETIEAHSVVVAGGLEGDVAASGTVRLVAGARVRGNLKGSAVSIEEGARFSGRLDCEFDLPAELGGSPARGDGRGRTAARR